MEKEPGKIFSQIVGEAKNDKNILGLFLGGSRGKGLAKKNSDYDVYVIVRNKKEKSYKKKYPYKKYKKVDIIVFSLMGFQKQAKWGSPTEWNRYNYWQIKTIVDKTKNKRIQKIINEKSIFSMKSNKIIRSTIKILDTADPKEQKNFSGLRRTLQERGLSEGVRQMGRSSDMD